MGHDNIQSFFITAARFIIALVLTYFSTVFLLEGIICSCNGKIARVVPTYKIGAKDDVNNYRLISILTCFSKIIESFCIHVTTDS